MGKGQLLDLFQALRRASANTFNKNTSKRPEQICEPGQPTRPQLAGSSEEVPRDPHNPFGCCLRSLGPARGVRFGGSKSCAKKSGTGHRKFILRSPGAGFEARKRSKSVDCGPPRAHGGTLLFRGCPAGSENSAVKVPISGPLLPPLPRLAAAQFAPCAVCAASPAPRGPAPRRAFRFGRNPMPSGRDPTGNLSSPFPVSRTR